MNPDTFPPTERPRFIHDVLYSCARCNHLVLYGVVHQCPANRLLTTIINVIRWHSASQGCYDFED